VTVVVAAEAEAVATTVAAAIAVDSGLIRSIAKMATLRVKYIKSSIGYPKDQKATIRALGFRKLQQTVEHEDNPAMRGMIQKVIHLVQVEETVSETL
jgi:large subunit ribosomal protein L30